MLVAGFPPIRLALHQTAPSGWIVESPVPMKCHSQNTPSDVPAAPGLAAAEDDPFCSLLSTCCYLCFFVGLCLTTSKLPLHLLWLSCAWHCLVTLDVVTHCWLVTLAGALWDHFPACLPSFVGDPPPASEQLHYPPPNPSLAVTSAEHLTEISLSCGGSYSPTDLCFPFCGCSWLVSLPCLCSWRQHRLCSCAVVRPEFWGEHGT